MQTKRLLLRPFALEDVPAFLEHIFFDPCVWNELNGEVLDDPEQEAKNLIEQWQHIQYPPLVIERRQDSTFLGYIALKPIIDHPSLTQLTVALGSIYWGEGYATEACKQMLTEGFYTRELECVYGLVSPHNSRGHKLAKRLDMLFEGINQNYNYGEELAIYTFKRAVYTALYPRNNKHL